MPVQLPQAHPQYGTVDTQSRDVGDLYPQEAKSEPKERTESIPQTYSSLDEFYQGLKTSQIEHKAKLSLDMDEEPESTVNNEINIAYLWCTFICLYWSPCIWIPIMVKQSFKSSATGLITWCCGCIGMMSTFYLLKEGILCIQFK